MTIVGIYRHVRTCFDNHVMVSRDELEDTISQITSLLFSIYRLTLYFKIGSRAIYTAQHKIWYIYKNGTFAKRADWQNAHTIRMFPRNLLCIHVLENSCIRLSTYSVSIICIIFSLLFGEKTSICVH